ncbi:MAG: hypothetical protein WAT78_14180 [Rhizobiaceae bacterium]
MNTLDATSKRTGSTFGDKSMDMAISRLKVAVIGSAFMAALRQVKAGIACKLRFEVHRLPIRVMMAAGEMKEGCNDPACRP